MLGRWMVRAGGRPVLGGLLSLSLLVVVWSGLPAMEVSGVRLPVAERLGERELALRGADLLRWKWVVKIYVAAFYLPPQVPSTEALDEVPRRIAFHYRRGFTAAHLVEATNATITRGLDPVVATRIAPAVSAFNALYPAVQAGDVMAIDYEPGAGTTMRLNGTVLGTVPGAEFARALFAIWLGDHAVDDGLKAALLGRR
jgi:hypothetical protein